MPWWSFTDIGTVLYCIITFYLVSISNPNPASIGGIEKRYQPINVCYQDLCKSWHHTNLNIFLQEIWNSTASTRTWTFCCLFSWSRCERSSSCLRCSRLCISPLPLAAPLVLPSPSDAWPESSLSPPLTLSTHSSESLCKSKSGVDRSESRGDNRH